jgi:branched-chain amino acid transport system substrate-binding protein
VETVWGDDQTKPDIGRQLADKMVESDRVQLMTGINFSNVLLAVIKPTLSAGIPYVSINAAPSQLAGKGCQPMFFSLSHQNDALFESVGEYMQKKGIPSVYMIAPNYPAGRDMLNGFKRFYKGEIKGEVYTAFPAMDFSSQIAEIREKKPSAILFFLPGGMTVNFVKQFVASGLKDIPLYSGAGSVDALTLPALGDAAQGITVITNWTEGLPDNKQSLHFAEAFEKKYGRIPSAYAAVAYDSTRALNAAIASIGGKVEDKQALRKAIDTVKFDSLRDGFGLNTNQFPIQNMYETVVGKDAQGRWTGLYKGTAIERKKDSFAQDCHLPPPS